MGGAILRVRRRVLIRERHGRPRRRAVERVFAREVFDALDKCAPEALAREPARTRRGPDGTAGGGYLAEALKSAYDAIDERLINHIARLGEPECWSGSTCTSVLVRPDRSPSPRTSATAARSSFVRAVRASS